MRLVMKRCGTILALLSADPTRERRCQVLSLVSNSQEDPDDQHPPGQLLGDVAPMTATVAWITYAPVKGLALTHADEVGLDLTGVRENRRFHLVTAEGRLVNGKVAGSLVQVGAVADRDGTHLSLHFPDGSTVGGEVALGAAIETDFWGRPVAARLVEGDFSSALSAFVGRPLRLLRVNEPGDGSDRGVDGSVSIVSNGTLDRLAREAGQERVDGRRFRMLFGIDGVGEHVEETWVGGQVAIGDAVIRLRELVGRCAVTTQDPDTGVPDLDTLRVLARYRSDVESEEPLPIGVWGGVEQPGTVRVGDPVSPL